MGPVSIVENDDPMTHEELIEIARAHTKDIPRLSDESWATDDVLNKVAVQDTVIVCFKSDQHSNRVMILLDKDSGTFIASWLTEAPADEMRRLRI